jgi:zinc protease
MKPIYILATLGLMLTACQQTTPTSRYPLTLVAANYDSEQGVPYEKYRLSNGLTVLFIPTEQKNLVEVNVKYRVGSADEQPHKTGYAHLFEHMMFEGSQHVASGQHIKMVTDAGGYSNASTSQDVTNYFEKVPNNHLEQVLWLEADRMGFLLPAITQTNLNNQREVVFNERRQRRNQPYGRVPEQVLATLHPASHPYAHAPIGSVADLEQASLADVRDFYNTWYVPNNAVLTIAGDFNSAQARTWISRYFGAIPAKPLPRRFQPQVPALTQDKTVVIQDRIHTPLIKLHPSLINRQQRADADLIRDIAALQVLSYFFNDGKQSVLYRELVEPQQALQAGMYVQCQLLTCEIGFHAAANPQAKISLTQLEQRLRQVIQSQQVLQIEPTDLKRVHAAILMAKAQNQIYMNHKIDSLSHSELFYQNPARQQRILKMIKAVTIKDIKRVYQQYIYQQPMLAIHVQADPNPVVETAPPVSNQGAAEPEITTVAETATGPLAATTLLDGNSRTTVPTAPDIATFKVPTIAKRTTFKPYTHYHRHDANMPLTYIKLTFKHPIPESKLEYAGLSDITGNMLFEATQTMDEITYQKNWRALASGVRVRTDALNQTTTMLITTLPQHLHATMALVKQGLMQPKFQAHDLKQMQTQLVNVIEERPTQDTNQAQQQFQQLLYGQTFPEAIPYPRSVEEVQALTLDHVKRQYQQMVVNSHLYISSYSAQPAAEIEQSLQFLTDWHQPLKVDPLQQAKAPPMSQPKSAATDVIYFLEQPHARQTSIYMGRLTQAFDNDAHFFLQVLANYPLGGRQDNLLDQRLREEKGYTYGIGSSILGSQHHGTFQLQTQVHTHQTVPAYQDIIDIMSTYQSKPIEDAPLKAMQTAWLESLGLRYEQPLSELAQLDHQLHYDLPDDYQIRRQQVVSSLTPAKLHASAKATFDHTRMVKLIAGPKSVLTELQAAQLPVKVLTPPSK